MTINIKNLIFISILLPILTFANDKIIFVGDSITQGGFEFSKVNYVELIQNRLKKEGYEVTIIKYACAGTPTGTSLKYMLDKLPKDLPDLVVINSGIVDAVFRVPPLAVKANLSRMIQLCFEHNSKVILGVIDISSWSSSANERYILEFNEVYKTLPNEYSITTFPFLNNLTLGNKKYNFGDFVHPNQKGDQLICDFLYPEIIKHLNNKKLEN